MALKEKIAFILNSINSAWYIHSFHISRFDIKSKEDFFILLNSIPYMLDKIRYHWEWNNYGKPFMLKIFDRDVIIVEILFRELRSMLFCLNEYDISNWNWDHLTEKEFIEILDMWADHIMEIDKALRIMQHYEFFPEGYLSDFKIKQRKTSKLKKLKTLPKRFKKLLSSEDLVYDNKNIEYPISQNLNKNMYVISSSYFPPDTKPEELEKYIFPIFDETGIRIENAQLFEDRLELLPDLTEFNIHNQSLADKLCESYDRKCNETNAYLQSIGENSKPLLLLRFAMSYNRDWNEKGNYILYKTKKEIPFSIEFIVGIMPLRLHCLAMCGRQHSIKLLAK